MEKSLQSKEREIQLIQKEKEFFFTNLRTQQLFDKNSNIQLFETIDLLKREKIDLLTQIDHLNEKIIHLQNHKIANRPKIQNVQTPPYKRTLRRLTERVEQSEKTINQLQTKYKTQRLYKRKTNLHNNNVNHTAPIKDIDKKYLRNSNIHNNQNNNINKTNNTQSKRKSHYQNKENINPNRNSDRKDNSRLIQKKKNSTRFRSSEFDSPRRKLELKETDIEHFFNTVSKKSNHTSNLNYENENPNYTRDKNNGFQNQKETPHTRDTSNHLRHFNANKKKGINTQSISKMKSIKNIDFSTIDEMSKNIKQLEKELQFLDNYENDSMF